MQGSIYKITNTINCKSYIGKTYNSIEERFRQHIRDSRKDRNKNRPLYRAIKKYGEYNFTLELLGIYEEGILEEKEIYFIKKYNTYSKGYNATLGGDGKRYITLKDSDIIETYKREKSMNKTAKVLKVSSDYISLVLKSNKVKCFSKKESLQSLSKPVIQMSKSDKVLNEFDSIADASIYLGDIEKKTHIVACCKGKRKTAYGYKWKYKE